MSICNRGINLIEDRKAENVYNEKTDVRLLVFCFLSIFRGEKETEKMRN